MREQLVEGYLREHADARHGVYVVGDFTCDAWADGEKSRRSRRLGGRAALQATLNAQATELSRGGQVRGVVLDAALPNDAEGFGHRHRIHPRIPCSSDVSALMVRGQLV